MWNDIKFESMLAEAEAFAKTLEFGYSSLTNRYEPKKLTILEWHNKYSLFED